MRFLIVVTVVVVIAVYARSYICEIVMFLYLKAFVIVSFIEKLIKCSLPQLGLFFVLPMQLRL